MIIYSLQVHHMCRLLPHEDVKMTTFVSNAWQDRRLWKKSNNRSSTPVHPQEPATPPPNHLRGSGSRISTYLVRSGKAK